MIIQIVTLGGPSAKDTPVIVLQPAVEYIDSGLDLFTVIVRQSLEYCQRILGCSYSNAHSQTTRRTKVETTILII